MIKNPKAVYFESISERDCEIIDAVVDGGLSCSSVGRVHRITGARVVQIVNKFKRRMSTLGKELSLTAQRKELVEYGKAKGLIK